MSETVDEVVNSGPATRSSGLGHRAVVNESLSLSGGVEVDQHGIEQDQIREGGGTGRTLKESTAKLIEQYSRPNARSTDSDGEPIDTDDPDVVPANKTGDNAAAVQATSAGESTVEGEAKAEDTVKEGGEEVVTLKSENARLAEHNRKLLEQVNKVTQRELSEREKALDEAERMYLDDNVGAIRRLIAQALGVNDPSHKDVDEELKGLYVDLTSKELNIPLETSHKAAREALRARQLFARDKRERKAEESEKANRASEDEGTRRAREAAAFIEPKLSKDAYPLLNALSNDFDGMDPGLLVWRVIERETAAGTLDVSLGDAKLIEAASKLIEDHYKQLAEKIVTITKSKDAVPSAAPAVVEASKEASIESKDKKQTITNAQASVAPATPAKKVEGKAVEKPKFRNDKERRAWALRHLPE